MRGARICGVEITPTSESVVGHPFGGTTAFLMGNEGHGLTEAQLAACDQTVYIPQHSGATASLNVNAAAAVVLHHFATWASLPEAPRTGFKFDQVAPRSAEPRSGVGLKQMRTLQADGSLAPRGGGGGGDDGADGDGDGAFDLFSRRRRRRRRRRPRRRGGGGGRAQGRWQQGERRRRCCRGGGAGSGAAGRGRRARILARIRASAAGSAERFDDVTALHAALRAAAGRRRS